MVQEKKGGTVRWNRCPYCGSLWPAAENRTVCWDGTRGCQARMPETLETISTSPSPEAFGVSPSATWSCSVSESGSWGVSPSMAPTADPEWAATHKESFSTSCSAAPTAWLEDIAFYLREDFPIGLKYRSIKRILIRTLKDWKNR